MQKTQSVEPIELSKYYDIDNAFKITKANKAFHFVFIFSAISFICPEASSQFYIYIVKEVWLLSILFKFLFYHWFSGDKCSIDFNGWFGLGTILWSSPPIVNILLQLCRT